ncbi:uncharacterized protein LAJ45_00033 [Morchella importuna]|uniref:uncharacterized protein n=1 Tax=Morchella importuna TaxID=1174673 RepID=UPI001E8D20AC|nr:uncharacterized protein LAJ45_00033 [Morchella importuna]KAH8155025.1 hypothetical protein LAJ45_00033 [Morchella importuna]
MVERPLYEDVSSSSSSSCGGSSCGSCSDGEEEEGEEGSGAGAGKKAGKMKTKEKNETGKTTTAMKPSLKRPLGPDEEKKVGKKRKKVSWAKVVSVRHYPEDSYPDGRRFEGRHRKRGDGAEGGWWRGEQ